MDSQSKLKKLAENEAMELLGTKERYGDRPSIVLHEKVYFDHRARLAVSFAERWAMVAGEADGEDSAGRAKVRRMTPQELAKHACDTVDAFLAQFSERGWAIHAPGLEQVGETLAEEALKELAAMQDKQEQAIRDQVQKLQGSQGGSPSVP